jgi:hypothetical protein
LLVAPGVPELGVPELGLATGLDRIAEVPGSAVACGKRARNVYKLTSPTSVITANNTRHTARNLCRAFSPEVIPHFAVNSQTP